MAKKLKQIYSGSFKDRPRFDGGGYVDYSGGDLSPIDTDWSQNYYQTGDNSGAPTAGDISDLTSGSTTGGNSISGEAGDPAMGLTNPGDKSGSGVGSGIAGALGKILGNKATPGIVNGIVGLLSAAGQYKQAQSAGKLPSMPMMGGALPALPGGNGSTGYGPKGGYNYANYPGASGAGLGSAPRAAAPALPAASYYTYGSGPEAQMFRQVSSVPMAPITKKKGGVVRYDDGGAVAQPMSGAPTSMQNTASQAAPGVTGGALSALSAGSPAPSAPSLPTGMQNVNAAPAPGAPIGGQAPFHGFGGSMGSPPAPIAPHMMAPPGNGNMSNNNPANFGPTSTANAGAPAAPAGALGGISSANAGSQAPSQRLGPDMPTPASPPPGGAPAPGATAGQMPMQKPSFGPQTAAPGALGGAAPGMAPGMMPMRPSPMQPGRSVGPGATGGMHNFMMRGRAMADGGSTMPSEESNADMPHGALSGRHVTGPGDGTSDSIPARLANGEYVFSADVVASLGNGDNGSGAKVLDKFVHNVRTHKAQNMAKGKLPANAKPVEKYMGGK